MRAIESIAIHAPIDVVWQVLTEIDQWPRWQRAVGQASLQGSLAPSSEFRWTSGGLKIRSRIEEVNAPSSIRWLGSALGTKADHAWSLASTGTGTEVTTVESMSGWLVSLMGLFNKEFLANSLKQTLADLKEESESRYAV